MMKIMHEYSTAKSDSNDESECHRQAMAQILAPEGEGTGAPAGVAGFRPRPVQLGGEPPAD